jgi:hypothetical protein
MGYPRSQAAMSGVMVQLLLPLLLLLLLTTALNVAAQTAAASDCTQYVADLSSCQNYLNNAAAVPGTDCCSGIATVEKDSVSCLCAIVSQLVGAASGVNLTRVYAVPKDCNLTFNNSSCSGNSRSVFLLLLLQPLCQTLNLSYYCSLSFPSYKCFPRCNIFMLK